MSASKHCSPGLCADRIGGIPLSGSGNILSAALCEHVTLVCERIGREGREGGSCCGETG